MAKTDHYTLIVREPNGYLDHRSQTRPRFDRLIGSLPRWSPRNRPESRAKRIHFPLSPASHPLVPGHRGAYHNQGPIPIRCRTHRKDQTNWARILPLAQAAHDRRRTTVHPTPENVHGLPDRRHCRTCKAVRGHRQKSSESYYRHEPHIPIRLHWEGDTCAQSRPRANPRRQPHRQKKRNSPPDQASEWEFFRSAGSQRLAQI